MQPILFGEHRHTLDAKGRLCIPARILKTLGDPFYVVKGYGVYLNVYSSAAWEDLARKLSALPAEQARVVRREIFSSAQECTADGQGRILIAHNLREYAKIETSVVVAGAEKYAEIWDSALWDGREKPEDIIKTALNLIDM